MTAAPKSSGKKVVVVASLAWSLINFRGQLLSDMVAAGHDVVAVAPEDDPEVARELAARGVRYRVVPMRRASISIASDIRTLMALYGLFRAERPDLVLAYTQKPIVYAGLAARMAGIPRFVAMISGLGHVFSDGGGRAQAVLRGLVSQLYRQALTGVATVFVFNSDDRAELLKHRIITADVPVVQVPGSGIDTRRFVAAPLPAGAPVFLLVARLLRNKGLYEFVEAARRIRANHPEVRCQLLGPRDPNPAGITAAELASWQAEGVIEYLGETRDVVPFFAGASVFVLPTWYREGLPRTILEAMASGRAVITSLAPGCRDAVEDGANGWLVPVRDTAALTAAMQRFVDDPQLIVAMGARSRMLAEARYDVRIVNHLLLSTMNLLPPAPAAAQLSDAA
ncbi:glycosyltransferase family 4 protein [Glacieibacterium sp.]|uniref:glycosyltransferase family 4 protein n=1 Tax=Glacieibacterium sp. TaxID=2860237 RepID=UPI003AFFE492